MKAVYALGLAVALAFPIAAQAAEHEVMMLNKGSDGTMMVFEPLVIMAQPGDTIKFVPTDKSHNSATIKDGVPPSAEPWKGKVNEEITVTVSEEGVYMYQCTPHFGMGMMGAVVVGEPTNLEEVRKLRYPGKAKQVAEKIFAEIEAGS